MTTIIDKDDYLDALGEEVQENSKFVKIEEGEAETLLFILKDKPQYKEEFYNNQPTGTMKTFWTVVNVNSKTQKEQTFKTADGSTKLIAQALKQSKDNLLEITREGTGSKTVYRPTVVNPTKNENKDKDKNETA